MCPLSEKMTKNNKLHVFHVKFKPLKYFLKLNFIWRIFNEMNIFFCKVNVNRNRKFSLRYIYQQTLLRVLLFQLKQLYT